MATSTSVLSLFLSKFHQNQNFPTTESEFSYNGVRIFLQDELKLMRYSKAVTKKEEQIRKTEPWRFTQGAAVNGLAG